MILAGPRCVDLVKASEGFRASPYLCPAGVPTIGYGTTRYPTGKAVSLRDKMISEHEASVMLEMELASLSRKVCEVCGPAADTQGKIDALVSFTYNLGIGALQKSTLLRRLKAGKIEEAADEFLRWTRANGKILPGLVERRKAERLLFLSDHILALA